jgi:hypothetical protein
MAFDDTKTRGIVLVCIGLWLLPLTWTIYVKYERQRRVQDGASVPLMIFLAISALGVAGMLWYEYRKRTGQGLNLGGDNSQYGNLGSA